MHLNYKAFLVSVHVFSVFLVHCLTHFARYFLSCIYLYFLKSSICNVHVFVYFFSFRFFSILISKLKAKKVNCASSKRGQDNKRDFDMFPEKCSQFPT